MPDISRSEIVPYSAAQMYELVDAIEKYPEFLPWCSSAKEHSRDEDEVHATLELSKGVIRKTFTTCNRIQHHKMIEIRLVNGPFEHLEGLWRFDDLEDGQSKVCLDMEFRFAGRLISMAFGPVFHQIANRLVGAFTERAVDVYGS